MTTPDRARSRLRPVPTQQTPIWQNWSTAFGPVFHHYLPWLPWLGITATATGVTLLVMTRFTPSAVADVLLPQSYLVLCIPVWLAISSLATFLFRHLRWGWELGSVMTVLLLLHLNHIQLSWQYLCLIVMYFVIMELFLYLREKAMVTTPSPSHAKTHRSPLPPRRPFDYRH